MKKTLLTPDPAEGAAPAAAEIVLKTPVEETDASELVKMKRQLESERAARKQEQIRLSSLEDENRALKNIPLLPPERAVEQKKSFLEGINDFIESI